MATFKIVQIIEDGNLLLWTVPSSWENNGKLRYPRYSKSKLDKLRRDSTSIPEENWITIDCVVKRSNFPSFKAAEFVNKTMSDVSDTETEIDKTNSNAQMSSHGKKKIDLNDLVRSCVGNQPQTNTPSAIDAEIVVINAPEPLSPEKQPIEEVSVSQPAGNTSAVTNDQILQINSKLEGLTTTMTTILGNQEILCANQIMMLQKLADISTQFDEFIKRTSQSVGIETLKRGVDLVKITDKKGLDDFEESLKNKHTAQELKKSLSVICGVGKGKAINNAYTLMDTLFERKFLVGCSWAGGTRAEGSKICFKSYQNTIDLFFDIIYTSDPEFTKQECLNFLKSVLRNSKKRCNSQNIRTSHQKKRATKLKIKTKIPEDNNDNQVKEGVEKISHINDLNKELEEEESLDLC